MKYSEKDNKDYKDHLNGVQKDLSQESEEVLRKEYGLTPKQWNFVQHFLHSRSPKQAFAASYDVSNYSPYNITKGGWTQMRNAKIKNAIASELDSISKSSKSLYIFDKKWFMQQYEALIEQCMKEKDLSNWNRALSQLAQLMGVNEAMKIEAIDTKVSIKLDLTSESEDDNNYEDAKEVKDIQLPQNNQTINISNDLKNKENN